MGPECEVESGAVLDAAPQRSLSHPQLNDTGTQPPVEEESPYMD